MEEVLSMVCFGGLSGKTVSISNGSPAIVTLSNHGLRPECPVFFTTTGSLPVGISANVAYYPRSTSATTFNLYDTKTNAIAGGATGRINTSSAGSGMHTCKSMKVSSGVSLSRWGSTRIYDGITSWYSARGAIASFDTEVCEINDAFTEIASSLQIKVSAATFVITTMVNGVRSEGFHAGVYGAGYICSCYELVSQSYDSVIDGFSVSARSTSYIPLSLGTNSAASRASKMIAIGPGSAGTGIICAAARGIIENCLAKGFSVGFQPSTYTYGLNFTSNLATGNVTGFAQGSSSTTFGKFYNNISIGNTTNWAATPTGLEGASNNAGLSSDSPWKIGTGSTIAMATTDFVSYATNDFRPLSVSSPQVDSGIKYPYSTASDISDKERPNYNNGGSEYFDVGPYEFDHGYGPHPASHVLTLTNVVVGSRVFIQDQTSTTTHYDQIAAGSNVVITVTVYGDSRDNWRIKVRNASGSPAYVPYETLMTATAGSSSIYVSQIPDE